MTLLGENASVEMDFIIFKADAETATKIKFITSQTMHVFPDADQTNNGSIENVNATLDIT